MLEKTWVVGPFQCNCRLFVCPRTGQAILVDPGDEPEKILESLRGLKTAQGVPVQIRSLLHTHGHLDHIGATRAIYESTRSQTPTAPSQTQPEKPGIALHPADEPLYKNLKMQGQLFGFQYEDPLPITHFLQDEETLQFGDMKLTVLHTPGHSPGSVSIRLHENSVAQIPELVLTGDTLFQGSVGRTDLWGANQDQMFKSIRQRILVLDDDIRVCPGHGADTCIGIEKGSNPFLQSR